MVTKKCSTNALPFPPTTIGSPLNNRRLDYNVLITSRFFWCRHRAVTIAFGHSQWAKVLLLLQWRFSFNTTDRHLAYVTTMRCLGTSPWTIFILNMQYFPEVFAIFHPLPLDSFCREWYQNDQKRQDILMLQKSQ